jgi:flagellin
VSLLRGLGAAPVVLRHLQRNQRLRDRLFEQVASGRRLVRSRDGPAQLAIASKMNVRIRSRKRVIQNIEDARSALQTADGGLDQIQNVVARLRELAVAAASGTQSDSARLALMTEAAQMATEIDRLALSTHFMGAPVLAQSHVDVGFVIDASGSMGGELAQVVASITSMVDAFNDAGIDAHFGIAGVRANLDPVDGLRRYADIGDPGFAAALAGLPIAGGAVDPYSALLNATGADDFNGDGDAFSWRVDTLSHVIYVSDTGQETQQAPGPPTQSEVAAQLGLSGVAVHVIARPPNHGVFSSITSTTGGGLYDIGNSSGDNIPTALDQITQSMLGSAPTEYGPITINVGVDALPEDEIDLGLALDSTRVALGLTGLSLSTAVDAGDALEDIDAAMDVLSSNRASVGAMSNRLSYAMGNHRTTLTNEVEAASRLEDLDYAEATADLARTEVLQATGNLLLARALRQDKDIARQLIGMIGSAA